MCLDMMLSALNDCDVLCANIQNAYMNSKSKDKVYIRLWSRLAQFGIIPLLLAAPYIV